MRLAQIRQGRRLAGHAPGYDDGAGAARDRLSRRCAQWLAFLQKGAVLDLNIGAEHDMLCADSLTISDDGLRLRLDHACPDTHAVDEEVEPDELCFNGMGDGERCAPVVQ